MKRFSTFFSSLIMAASLFSQEMPAVDKIHSSEGTIELHFIGHGTLFFNNR